MSLRIKGLAGFILICLLWGSSWAAVKLGLETVPPLFALGLRFVLASTILAAIIMWKRLVIPKTKKFWMLVLIMITTSFTVPFVLIYWGQMHVDSGLSAVLFATYPFWVALVSHFLLPKEKITLVRMIGIVIGFLGVLFIFKESFSQVTSSTFYGMGTIIAGAIIQAFGLVFLRRLGEDAHPVTLNFCSMSLSGVVLFIASVLLENFTPMKITLQALGAVLYLSVFCTVITFVVYFWLVKHMEVVVLSLSAFITPIIAVAVGVLLLGETINRSLFIGSALVLVGVAAASVGDIYALYSQETTEV
jgi:putative membrane protein PagO